MLLRSLGEQARLDLGQAVSDATTPRLRVSREGIVLIKSFEGFRPHAVPTRDGGWMIGYGHTASAREGLTVCEEDAELLLQYDLLPVVRALNDRVPGGLNQHQFDALASFAMSVGVERFLVSDVLQQLTEGRAGQAADALIGWPEEPSPDSPLRRRAAERALFNAAPGDAMTVADLLSAPLPARPVETARNGDTASPAPAGPATAAERAPADKSISDVAAPAADDTPPSGSEASATSPFPAVDQPLGLTPLTDADLASVETVVSPEEAPAPTEGDASTPAPDQPTSSVLRHELDPEQSGRLEWADTGMYVFIGVMGLLSCGFASAAFRLAVAKPSPLGETAVVGWALALIGVICVSVSAWNLYVRWSRRD